MKTSGSHAVPDQANLGAARRDTVDKPGTYSCCDVHASSSASRVKNYRAFEMHVASLVRISGFFHMSFVSIFSGKTVPVTPK